jgi:hypothetical protein
MKYIIFYKWKSIKNYWKNIFYFILFIKIYSMISNDNKIYLMICNDIKNKYNIIYTYENLSRVKKFLSISSCDDGSDIYFILFL